MKRIFKPIHYVVYVIVLSLLYGLFTAITLKLESGIRFKTDRIINLAALVIPFVFCQIVFAILVVRNLSLKKLFSLSAIFTFVSCILSVIVFPLLIKLGPTHIIAFHWNLLELLLMFGVPVLILLILQQRSAKSKLKKSLESTQAVDSNVSNIETSQTQQIKSSTSYNSYWWHWDIAIAAVPVWFGILLDPFGIVNYMCGLINVPIHLVAAFCSILLIPAGIICLSWFVVRMFIIWPRNIRPWHRLLLYWAIVIGVVAFFIGPFIIRILPPPFERYACGLRRHFQAKTDIEAIQVWLGTLDPKNIQDKWLDMHVRPDAKKKYMSRIIPAPNAIACLRPKSSSLKLDDSGRPMIRLMWGSGMAGSWGLVVGDKDMEIPETQRPRWEEIRFGKTTQKKLIRGEARFPVAPGAYAWYELE